MLTRKTVVDILHKNRDWRVFTRPYSGQWYFALMLREAKFVRRLEPLYWINLLIMLLGGMWAISLLGISFRKLARSIGELAAGAQAIATGDLDKRVAIDRTEELGTLGRAFNNMAEALKNLIHERAEKEKLRDLNQLKDAFISNVSHELREPLEHIDLGVENLRRGGLGLLNEQQQSYLIRVQQNTKRMIRMIKELLDVARIESGSMTLHRSPCAVEEIVAEVIDETRPIWQKKSLNVHSTGDSGNGHVIADRDMLKQIVSNLMDNAIKFTNENGEISISSKRENASIELVVADSGVGIPPEYLPHIFDRFYQAPASKNDNGNRRKYGLGLGLNIVKTLVEAHSGKISVESQVGEGTRVKVSLPVE
jgi:signal transduction histidine kinase